MNTLTKLHASMLIVLPIVAMALPSAAHAEGQRTVGVTIADSLGRTVIATSPSALPGVSETHVCVTPCRIEVEPGTMQLTDERHVPFGTVGVPDHDIAIALPSPVAGTPWAGVAAPPAVTNSAAQTPTYAPGSVLITFGIATMAAGAQITLAFAAQAGSAGTYLPTLYITFSVTTGQAVPIATP